MFLASRHRLLDKAHMLNVDAISLEPEILIYRLNCAEVLADEKQYDSAINVLKMASRLAKKPSDVALVQNRIQDYENARNSAVAGSAATAEAN
jgi:predicted Zn-dependent protease